jgi:hypothetical protein
MTKELVLGRRHILSVFIHKNRQEVGVPGSINTSTTSDMSPSSAVRIDHFKKKEKGKRNICIFMLQTINYWQPSLYRVAYASISTRHYHFGVKVGSA